MAKHARMLDKDENKISETTKTTVQPNQFH